MLLNHRSTIKKKRDKNATRLRICNREKRNKNANRGSQKKRNKNITRSRIRNREKTKRTKTLLNCGSTIEKKPETEKTIELTNEYWILPVNLAAGFSVFFGLSFGFFAGESESFTLSAKYHICKESIGRNADVNYCYLPLISTGLFDVFVLGISLVRMSKKVK